MKEKPRSKWTLFFIVLASLLAGASLTGAVSLGWHSYQNSTFGTGFWAGVFAAGALLSIYCLAYFLKEIRDWTTSRHIATVALALAAIFYGGFLSHAVTDLVKETDLLSRELTKSGRPQPDPVTIAVCCGTIESPPETRNVEPLTPPHPNPMMNRDKKQPKPDSKYGYGAMGQMKSGKPKGPDPNICGTDDYGTKIYLDDRSLVWEFCTPANRKS